MPRNATPALHCQTYPSQNIWTIKKVTGISTSKKEDTSYSFLHGQCMHFLNVTTLLCKMWSKCKTRKTLLCYNLKLSTYFMTNQDFVFRFQLIQASMYVQRLLLVKIYQPTRSWLTSAQAKVKHWLVLFVNYVTIFCYGCDFTDLVCSHRLFFLDPLTYVSWTISSLSNFIFYDNFINPHIHF